MDPSRNALVQHALDSADGFRLDLASGAASGVSGGDRRHWINVHGALMAVAWVLLLPVGTFLPAHRWAGVLCTAQKKGWCVIAHELERAPTAASQLFASYACTRY